MTFDCAKNYVHFFQRSSESLKILRGFWQRDVTLRRELLSTLQRTFDSWYYGFGSPALPGILENVATDTGGATTDTTMHWLIYEQIADLLRISITAPSVEMRATANELLENLRKNKGFRIPTVTIKSPSLMIELSKMDHLSCLLDEPSEGEPYYTTHMLFREHWFQWGRLENYICVMGYHPEYLECFVKLHGHLFYADLPLPYPDRHYLAVMAAAEQKCMYLVLLFTRYFLASGGEPSWLEGASHGPAKWRQLAELNRNLANEPWKIGAEHIHDLTRGGDQRTSKETLSLSELMHAVSIMAHVHALACFVFGCAIRPEIDQEEDLFNMESTAYSNDNLRSDRAVETAVKLATTGSENKKLLSSTDAAAGEGLTEQLWHLIITEDVGWEEIPEDIVHQQFAETVRFNAKLVSELDPDVLSKATDLATDLSQHTAIRRFTGSSNSGYNNFTGKPFLASEYSWQEEGSALTDRLCFDLGTLLDEKFHNTRDLTYYTLNFKTNVDTTLYRWTVWNYVQSLFGICHDDFRYDRIDRLLTTEQRMFLKLCTTNPLVMSQCGFNHATLLPALSPSEFVHVILMAVEARQQACLLYVLRAISDCQARGR